MRVKRWVSLVLCGFIAGVFFFLFKAVTAAFFAEKLLSVLQTVPAYPRHGGEFFFVIDVLMGVWAIWLYSAISPHYGSRPGTAAIAGLAWWTIKSLQSANWIGLGFVPTEVALDALAPLAISLVSAMGAAMAGAFLYDRLESRLTSA